MARTLGVSSTYLSKVLQRLTRSGLLKSVTGPNGGFALAKEASEITLAEVVECAEKNALDVCVLGMEHCGEHNPCPVHDLWRDQRSELTRKLRSTKLSEAIDTGWPDMTKQRLTRPRRGRAR